jgi:hypothetical protein
MSISAKATETASAIGPISANESRDLIRLEDVIKRGLQTFVEVGEALAEIHHRKLYRTEHATFEAYLETKWKISRSRACRLIQAAAITKALPTGNKPTTERQTRPLTRLQPGQRAEAWKEAVGTSPTGTPTSNQVDAVVKKRTGEQPEDTKTPLQWLTHYWMLATEEDRRLFDNFIAGMRCGQ